MDSSLHLELFGSYPPALITLYGVPSSGKTCLCLQAALFHVQQGKKVLFVDTEQGFSFERFLQLAGDLYRTYLEKILLFSPKSFKHQHEIIQSIPLLLEKGNIGLVVVDTLSYYYRRFMKNRVELGNRMLIRQLEILTAVAKKIPVIVSNQIYNSIHDQSINIVGGNIVTNRSDYLIELVKEPKRKIVMKKPEQKEILFTIEEKGIRFI